MKSFSSRRQKMGSLDAITYFLVHYGLYSLLLVVPAALLGILFGWLVWGRFRHLVEQATNSAATAERRAQDAELMLSKERERFKQYRHVTEGAMEPPAAGPAGAGPEGLRAERDELARQVEALSRQHEESESRLLAARLEKVSLEKELEARPPQPEAPGSVTDGESAVRRAELEAELRELRRERDTTERELRELREEKRSLGAEGMAEAGAEGEGFAAERDALVRQLEAAQADLRHVRKELASLRQDHEKMLHGGGGPEFEAKRWADELHRLREEKKELTRELALRAPQSRALEVVQNEMRATQKRLEVELRDERRERRQAEDTITVLRRDLHELRREMKEARPHAGELQGSREDLHAAEERLRRAETELRRVREERKNLLERLAVSGGEPVEAGDQPCLADSDEEAGGKERDSKWGVVYSAAPADADELTRIRGLGSVTEQRLHKAGIYTFRQIAEWNDAMVDAFGKRLSVQNRIRRYDWRGQARELLREEEEGGEGAK